MANSLKILRPSINQYQHFQIYPFVLTNLIPSRYAKPTWKSTSSRYPLKVGLSGEALG